MHQNSLFLHINGEAGVQSLRWEEHETADSYILGRIFSPLPYRSGAAFFSAVLAA